jgi:hypothetical protein
MGILNRLNFATRILVKNLCALSVGTVAASLWLSCADATVLTGDLTADNGFDAYLSTADNTLGSALTSGNDWTTHYTFTSAPLVAGTTYYLHIVAANLGGPNNPQSGNPDGFIGSFSISDASFQFTTNTQTLVTDTAHWNASPGTFGPWFAPTGTPVVRCSNGGICGTGWSAYPTMGSAEWLWSGTDPVGQALFSATITPLTSGVPELSTWAMLILGFTSIGFTAYRRKSKPAMFAA